MTTIELLELKTASFAALAALMPLAAGAEDGAPTRIEDDVIVLGRDRHAAQRHRQVEPDVPAPPPAGQNTISRLVMKTVPLPPTSIGTDG
jgi:hypothetical protein